MTEPNPPDGDRVSALRRRVSDARARQHGETSQDTPSPAGLAMRFGGEFGAAILVGALLGYGVDVVIHTAPWGLGVGVGLGFITGVVNVVRLAQSYAATHPVDPNAPSIPDDADE